MRLLNSEKDYLKKMMFKMLKNIEIDNIKMWDAPDFSDAFVAYAEHENGLPLNELELDQLNENAQLVHELVYKEIYG